MRIGINGTLVSNRAALVELASHAARAAHEGFSSYWLGQWMSVDALTAIAAIARDAPRIELGTAVVPVHGRHPFALAAQALTAQDATQGRLQLGIGLSHRPFVQDQLGLSYDRPARYMTEYLEALEALLHTGEVKFRGELLRCEASLIRPDVAPPPVLLAALGPRMLELAGSGTAGTNLWLVGARSLREHVVPRIGEAAARAGRPAPRIVVGLPVCVTDDGERARQRVQRTFGATSHFDSYRDVLTREGVEGPEDVALIGVEGRVRDSLEEIRDAGATEFIAMELCKTDDEVRRTRALLRELSSRE